MSPSLDFCFTLHPTQSPISHFQRENRDSEETNLSKVTWLVSGQDSYPGMAPKPKPLGEIMLMLVSGLTPLYCPFLGPWPMYNVPHVRGAYQLHVVQQYLMYCLVVGEEGRPCSVIGWGEGMPQPLTWHTQPECKEKGLQNVACCLYLTRGVCG